MNMKRTALKIAYVGTHFHGFQRQPNVDSESPAEQMQEFMHWAMSSAFKARRRFA